MQKKTTKSGKNLYTRRSYEPLKMTVAVSACAAVVLVVLAVVIVVGQQ